MIELLLNGDKESGATSSLLEPVLNALASPRASSEERVDLLQRLENLFGRAVLTSEVVVGDTNFAQEWWNAQSCPETCVSLSLLSLLQRLHLLASVQASASTPADPTAEMTCCLTILQGLCLKDVTSRKIVSKSSSILLVLDITQAAYWATINRDSPAIAHAVDLLICVTMSSPSASRTFDALRGEETIRSTMERYAVKTRTKGSKAPPPLITLEDVQDSAIAMKCAECLLLYASEQDDAGNRTIENGPGSAMVDTSIVEHFARKHRKNVVRSAAQRHWRGGVPESSAIQRPSTASDRTATVIQRSRRARSMSPMKAREALIDRTSKEDRRSRSPTKEAASRIPITQPQPLLSISPSKLSKGNRDAAPFSRRLHSLDVNSKAHLKRMLTPDGDNRQEVTATRHTSGSPIKHTIGPSPAVRRAHERSVSPEKGRRKGP